MLLGLRLQIGCVDRRDNDCAILSDKVGEPAFGITLEQDRSESLPGGDISKVYRERLVLTDPLLMQLIPLNLKRQPNLTPSFDGEA